VRDTLTAVTVGRVTIETADQAAEAWKALAAEGMAPFADQDAHAAILARLAEPGRVLLCAVDGALPVGLSMFERMPDKRVRLEAIGVAPAFRRRGIGAALLTQGLFATLPAIAMFVLIPENDRAAIAWACDRSFRPRPSSEPAVPRGAIEYELRLDAPATGPGCGHDCACGAGGCSHDAELAGVTADQGRRP